MRIIVFGATGKTGRLVCLRALEQGHEVTGFTRSAARLEVIHPDLSVALGDVNDADAVSASVALQDAAIVALGSNGLRDKSTLATGTGNVVRGMSGHRDGRLVVLSAAGVGESWGQVSLLAKIAFKTMLRNIYADHAVQESVVQDSTLNWTIVRAGILKDSPATGSVTAGNGVKVRNITRADVADFLVGQVDDTSYLRQAISVTS